MKTVLGMVAANLREEGTEVGGGDWHWPFEPFGKGMPSMHYPAESHARFHAYALLLGTCSVPRQSPWGPITSYASVRSGTSLFVR